jgi:hypothetical protein
MAQSTRQTNLLVNQDWTKIYQAFSNADFTSYDFQTLRGTLITYLKTYYPDTFNDFLESSEYLALIDMIAFLGQSLSFRTDLNARENFIDTAQRRDSILKLARMLSYNPQRTNSASGLLKIDSIQTSETLYDSSGINLSNRTIYWNDITNDNWQEQFTTILNASLVSTQSIGKPGASQTISGIKTDQYSINLNPNVLPVAPFNINLQNSPIRFEAVSATTIGQTFIYEADPTKSGTFNLLYRNDNNGNNSNDTGFFVYFKQGTLQLSNFNIVNAIPNNFVTITTSNINQNDHWLYALDVNGNPQTLWQETPAIAGINVIYNQLTNKNLYQINSLTNDQVNLVFGDGSFSNIPKGNFAFYYRTSNGQSFTVTPDDLASVSIALNYVGVGGTLQTLLVTASLKYSVTNATASQTLDSIRTSAPQQYYTQNRMITAEDYQIFPQTQFSSIQKIKVVNRTSSGVSLYLDTIDPTGSYSATNIFCTDGVISANSQTISNTFEFLTTNDIYNAIYNEIIPIIASSEMINYYYANYPRLNAPNANIVFRQTANSTSSSSGYLTLNGNVLQVGFGISSNLQYVNTGASLQFSANAGNTYFNSQNQLVSGNISTVLGVGNNLNFYAAVTNVVSNSDSYTPNLVTFGTQVPTGAILSSVALDGSNAIIPPYKTSLTSSVVATVVGYINTQVNFGLYYNQVNLIWSVIPPSQIVSSTNWLIKFTYSNGLYQVVSQNLEYRFASSNQTTFYFDPDVKIYNPLTISNIIDLIKILKINSAPNSIYSMNNDMVWQIYNTVIAPDGYVDTTQVVIKSPSSQMEYVPDNPDLYAMIAGSSSTRNNLYFQYTHNSPIRNRIDPTPVNIMDVYILTTDYATSYINWLRDLTGTLTEPPLPTSSALELEYDTLDNYKTISDTLVYNPAKFKPLFGSTGNKVDPNLRARFQVVINPASTITANEIKTKTVATINSYFALSNWDFGDSFYFSELAAYLHAQLAPDLASVVIVPANSQLAFGNYFQINAEPWEIITSAATVNDIDVVSSVTTSQLTISA